MHVLRIAVGMTRDRNNSFIKDNSSDTGDLARGPLLNSSIAHKLEIGAGRVSNASST